MRPAWSPRQLHQCSASLSASQPPGPLTGCCTAHPTRPLLPLTYPLDLDSRMPTSIFLTLTSPTNSNPQFREPAGHIHLAIPLATDPFRCQYQVLVSPACLSALSPGSPSSGRTIHPTAQQGSRGPPWTTPPHSFISHVSPSVPPWTGPLASVARTTATLLPDGPCLHWNLSPRCHPGVFFPPKHKYAMQSFSCLNKFKWTRR